MSDGVSTPPLARDDYDAALTEHVGAFGRWQLLVFLLLTPIIASNACVNVAQTFAFYESDFRCRVPPCDDGVGDDGAAEYDAGFAAFAVPFWDDGEEDLSEEELRTKSCTNYRYVGNDTAEEGECTEDDFAQDIGEEF
jgi:hypothetical protein